MLNGSKTKKLVVVFRRKNESTSPVINNGAHLEMVIDDKLQWRENTTMVFKKAQKKVILFKEVQIL